MDRRHHRPRGRIGRRVLTRLLGLGLFGLGLAGCHHKVIRAGALDPAAVRAIGRDVERVRGLAFIEPVKVRLAGAADLRATAQGEVDRLQASGRARRQGQALALLGLLPSATALTTGTEAMISEQPGGVYRPSVTRLDVFDRPHVKSEIVEALGLFVGRDLTFGEIVAHELIHALQDQHFGLGGPGLAANNSDAELAHAALVEGDAFLAGFELGLGGLLADARDFVDFVREHAPDMGAEVPGYLQARFKFPYLAGAEFVMALKDADPDAGWAAIDRAHLSPPRSSEEVLHPERYLRADDPPRLPTLGGVRRAMRAEAGGGFEQVFEDTLGEFGLRTLLGAGAAARRRAAGWGGDRLGLYEDAAGRRALVWILDWDTEADAADFFDGFEARLIARHGPPDAAEQTVSTWRGHRLRHLELAGDRVVYLDGPGEAHLYLCLVASLRAEADTLGPAACAKCPGPQAAPKQLDPDQALVMDTRSPRRRTPGVGIRLGTQAQGMTLGALLQVRGVRNPGPLGEGLALHAARLSVDAQVASGLDLGLRLTLAFEELGTDRPADTLKDAVIRMAPVSPQLFYMGHFLIGRMKAPVSRYRLAERWALPMHVRPLTALAWAPDRRVGFAYDLDLAHHQIPVRLRAGVFDGLLEGRANGPLMAVRADFAPGFWIGHRVTLELGGAYFWDRNALPEPEADPLTRDRTGAVADAKLGWGPAWLSGEAFWFDAERGDGWERFGWSATFGVDLLPDFLELTGRWEELTAPDGSDDAHVQQASGGLNLFYLEDRFVLNFTTVWRRQAEEPDRWQHVLRFQLRI